MRERTFRALLVFIPCLSFSIIPTVIYGFTIGEWGSNPIWGRVFGFGWFVSQSLVGPTLWKISAAVGVFIWPPIIAYALFLISGLIYRSASRATRNFSLIIVLLSAAFIVPAHVAEAGWKPGSVPTDFNVLWNALY